jgi:glycosyltransferase involved in cell wall biosynthesis
MQLKHRFSRWSFLRRVRAVTTQADNVICVDTNFINVLRAMYPTGNWNERSWYIPNFAHLPEFQQVTWKWQRQSDTLRCIFPRRFAPLRGAVVFAELVRELAVEFSQVTFAFVGSGVCEPQMRQLLAGIRNVEIFQKPYEDMMSEYLKADIAVIPTIAAEGTSLSCIEAMAAGCAVVATNVGGLCNLVIPEFTGLLCKPTKTDLKAALIRLLHDAALRRQLAITARLAAERAFSREIWEERIWDVITKTAFQSIPSKTRHLPMKLESDHIQRHQSDECVSPHE